MKKEEKGKTHGCSCVLATHNNESEKEKRVKLKAKLKLEQIRKVPAAPIWLSSLPQAFFQQSREPFQAPEQKRKQGQQNELQTNRRIYRLDGERSSSWAGFSDRNQSKGWAMCTPGCSFLRNVF
jgi:hypothetical protein